MVVVERSKTLLANRGNGRNGDLRLRVVGFLLVGAADGFPMVGWVCWPIWSDNILEGRKVSYASMLLSEHLFIGPLKTLKDNKHNKRELQGWGRVSAISHRSPQTKKSLAPNIHSMCP